MAKLSCAKSVAYCYTIPKSKHPQLFFMREEILSNINDPAKLEKLYRTDKADFRRTFTEIYPTIKDTAFAAFWHERLSFSKQEISFGSLKERVFIILAVIVAGIIAKIPAMLSIDEDYF